MLSVIMQSAVIESVVAPNFLTGAFQVLRQAYLDMKNHSAKCCVNESVKNMLLF